MPSGEQLSHSRPELLTCGENEISGGKPDTATERASDRAGGAGGIAKEGHYMINDRTGRCVFGARLFVSDGAPSFSFFGTADDEPTTLMVGFRLRPVF